MIPGHTVFLQSHFHNVSKSCRASLGISAAILTTLFCRKRVSQAAELYVTSKLFEIQATLPFSPFLIGWGSESFFAQSHPHSSDTQRLHWHSEKNRFQQKSFVDQTHARFSDLFSKELMISFNSELYVIFSMWPSTYGYASYQVRRHVIRTD